MSKFSIIVPVYNAEKYLREALDSVLAQTFTDWECVCVDDGSRDSSGEILDEYGEKDKRFVVVHKDNGGEASARNLGLALSTGDWITCLDADDMYAHDRLEQMSRVISECQPDLVRFRITFIEENAVSATPINPSKKYEVVEGMDAKRWGWNILATRGLACTWAAKRNIVTGIEFKTGMRVHCDGIFCCRMANRLNRVAYSEYASYFYRQVSSSAMHSKLRKSDVFALFDAIKELCQTEVSELDVEDVMKSRFLSSCETQIIDWIENGDDVNRHTVCDVHRCFLGLKKSGVFPVVRARSGLWRLPLFLFEKYGMWMPIRMVCVYVAARHHVKMIAKFMFKRKVG